MISNLLDDLHTRPLSNTIEAADIITTVYHDLRVPEYPDDFDHHRASADLESILSGRRVDAFPWERRGNAQIIPNAGYGCIMETQLPECIQRLRADSSTRRASVVFWDGKGSPSCTLAADFKVRAGVLNAVFFQRSTDESQLPYDLFNFTGITRRVWEGLDDVQLGTLVLVTCSLHRLVG